MIAESVFSVKTLYNTNLVNILLEYKYYLLYVLLLFLQSKV